MKMMDCVEIIVEKQKYVKDGVHKWTQELTNKSKHNLINNCAFFKHRSYPSHNNNRTFAF